MAMPVRMNPFKSFKADKRLYCKDNKAKAWSGIRQGDKVTMHCQASGRGSRLPPEEAAVMSTESRSFSFLLELYLASHDSTDWFHNGSFFHCASGHGRQQRCVQEVVAGGDQCDVVLLAA